MFLGGSRSGLTNLICGSMGKYKVVSLFAGCGGMDLGFTGGFSFLGKKYPKRKFEVVWANDIFPDACKTYGHNLKHDIVCGDINEILNAKSVARGLPLPETADVVLGGFPCQDFSLAGKRRGLSAKRGQLYRAMVEVVSRVRPKVFVAENVKGLLSAQGGKAIETITSDFARLGYNISWKLHLAANYGVPQMRERILIVGTDKRLLPKFEHPDTVLPENGRVALKEAIGDLEGVAEGAVPNHYWSKAKRNRGQGNTVVKADRPGPTMRAEHHGNIELHWSGKRRLSAREAARIQSFPDSFEFLPSTSSAYKQVGNAVPPVMAWHLATEIQRFLDRNLK